MRKLVQRNRNKAFPKRGRRRRAEGAGVRSDPAERAVVFVLAAAIPVILALRDGSYELIARQEFGLVCWWAIAIGFALGWLPRARPGPGRRMALGGLVALVGWTLISLTWTQSDERTTAELARIVTYAGVLVLGWYGLRPGTGRAAAAGIAVAALVVPTLAVASRLLPDAAPWASFGAFLDTRRLLYPLGYWNALAAWASMAVAIGLSLSAHLRDPRLRALCLAAVPVAGLAVYLTYSRTGVAACALAVLGTLALAETRRIAVLHTAVSGLATAMVIGLVRQSEGIGDGSGGEGGAVVLVALALGAALCAWVAVLTRRSNLVAQPISAALGRRAAIAAALTAIGATVALGPPIASQAVDQLRSDDFPVQAGDPAARLTSIEGSRYAIWGSALGAFSSEPIQGIGPGTFEFWWSREGEFESVSDAHSLPIELLAELGLPGLVAAVALLGGLLTAALNRGGLPRPPIVGSRAGLIVAFLVFLLFAAVDWMWESTALTVLALIAAAAAAAERSESRHRAPEVPVRLALVGLALVASAVQVPGLVSAQRIRASTAELTVGEVRSADALASDAVDAQPWAATPHVQRALVALAREKYQRARRESLAAITREPTNWRHRVLQARVELEAGDEAAARVAVEQAFELRPIPSAELEAIRGRLTFDLF